MKIIRLFIACLVCAFVALSTLDAQRSDAPRTSGGTLAPLAISGSPSSALHCVSGIAANVHPLGWLTEGTGYTITFNSDVDLSTAVGRVDLEGDDAIAVYGTPELNFTASTTGTMALFVSGNGRAGCYRYKVQIDPPSSTTAAVPASGRATLQQHLAKGTKASFGTTAITGTPSSAKYCVGGNGVARVHALGYADAGAVVTIRFSSDFDPIAGVLVVDPIGKGGSYLIDDDTGGGNQPEINFTTSRSGNLALYVSGYGGTGGCYRFQSSIEGGGGEAPLTITEVAAPLAEAVASETVLALESGTISEASLGLGSQGFSPLTVATRRCRRAGTVSIRNFTSSGGRHTLSGATAIFSGCTFVVRTRTVAINAAIALNGTWCPGQGTGTCNRFTVSGAVPFPGGNAPLEGPITQSSFAITITGAGLQQGVPDTAPPPSPDTCPVTLNPTSVSGISAGGGAFTINVTNIGATCPWTVSSQAGYITVTAINTGRGPGTASFRVAANTGAARSGSVSVAGQTVRVSQNAGTTPPVGGPFDGTYDFFLTHPVQGGQTTQTLSRFFIVTNNNIRSSGGELTGAVTSTTSGAVRFTGPCHDGSGGTATFTGNLVAGTLKSGSGSYTCQNNIVGGTWRVANGR